MTLHLSPVLGAMNRLDCAITALRCVISDLTDDPDNEDFLEVATLGWLYDVLREEAHNLRQSVEALKPETIGQPEMRVAETVVAGGSP